MRAAMDLDARVGQAGQVVEPRLVVCGLARLIRDQGDDGGVMPGTGPPQVEIADPVAIDLERTSHALRQGERSDAVECAQHRQAGNELDEPVMAVRTYSST
jgi:hypothetical protein